MSRLCVDGDDMTDKYNAHMLPDGEDKEEALAMLGDLAQRTMFNR